MTLYLSRLTLNRAASARSLIPLINPGDPKRGVDAHHRLIWSVFSDSEARERDFLWRRDKDDRFFTLSSRRPRHSDLFLPPETKVFDPNLHRGDRLTYVLRANATRAKRMGPRQSKRVDVVMDLLQTVPAGPGRASARQDLAIEAAKSWIEAQGTQNGFASSEAQLQGYMTLDLGRRRKERARFGILDLTGTIVVEDPDLFLAALARGFGRAKSWGCGLMLIKRTR